MADQFKPVSEDKRLLWGWHNTFVRANANLKVDTQVVPGNTEFWTIQTLSNGRVMFKSSFGTYLRALPGMPANCDLVTKPEMAATFDFLTNPDGYFSFKTIYNTYVRTQPGEAGIVDVQTFIGPWEKFRFITDGSSAITAKKIKEKKFNLKTQWNYFVAPLNNNDRSGISGQVSLNPQAVWTIEYYNNGRVAIKSSYGTYIRAFPGGESALVELRKGSVTPWETYDLTNNVDDGSVSFRTVHNTYLRPRENMVERMDQHPEIGYWERLRLVPVA